MKFNLNKSLEILERTPAVLQQLLSGLSGEWVLHNEGGDTWSPFDIVGHLIHGERTDWIPRLRIILESGTSKPFEPFDRFAQMEESKGKSIDQLLQEFTRLRQNNLHILKNTPLDEKTLDKKGLHPALGEATLRQLLATWTAHDLNHLAQMARVMAKQYKAEVGPWAAYLGVMNA